VKKNIFLTMVVVSLFFSGCLSPVMKSTTLISKPDKKKAIVNFVNPWRWDCFHIWEGEKYIGILDDMSMIQIEVEPGKHTFISYSTNWSYASGELVAGKQYFIKINPLPFRMVALGVAKSDDKRVYEWLDELTPITLIGEKERKKVEMEYKEEILKAVANFKNGKVSRFATIHPNDGHTIVFHPKPKKKEEPLIQGI